MAVVLFIGSAATAARAQERRDVQPPAEAGIVVEQLVVGTATGIFTGFGSLALAVDKPAVGIPLVATSGLSGGSVCVLGQSSEWYEGSCAGPMVGAFVGSLAFGLPVARWAVNTGEESSAPYLLAALAGAVGSGVGATLGWHLTKHRRPGVVVPPSPSDSSSPPVAAAQGPGPAWPEMPVRRLEAAPGTVTMPVLALTF